MDSHSTEASVKVEWEANCGKVCGGQHRSMIYVLALTRGISTIRV